MPLPNDWDDLCWEKQLRLIAEQVYNHLPSEIKQIKWVVGTGLALITLLLGTILLCNALGVL